jgi:predicted kinase
MPKLVICKGLPGSGKSTWAQAQPGAVVVNKDTIRRKLEETGWVWSHEGEKEVISRQDNDIRAAFWSGVKLVISDDTNLAPKHEARLKRLAVQLGAEVEIVDFTGVPIEVCIERDSKREGKARVGDKVIKDMATKYLGWKEEMVKYVSNPSLTPAIICDLDGTAALHNGRSPYEYNRCDEDLVNEPVREILLKFASDAYEIIYLSGREDYAREKTKKWLEDNWFPRGNLFMRKSGDHRSDVIVKYELFDREVRNVYNVLFCLDDRDRVVKLWRDLGLTCLQVNYGNF